MAIRIGTNKTVVKGVRGREITSIKALRKDQLPAEYLATDGAVYLASLRNKRGAYLYICNNMPGYVGPSPIMLPHVLLKTGQWLPEKTFQAKRAKVLRAGNQLVEINKRQLAAWYGTEIVAITEAGMIDTNTITGFNEIKNLVESSGGFGERALQELYKLSPSGCGSIRAWLFTSKVNENKKRYRVLKNELIIECGGVVSAETCETAGKALMKILVDAELPDYAVTEQRFQKVVLKLRRAIQYAESQSWQGRELVKI